MTKAHTKATYASAALLVAMMGWSAGVLFAQRAATGVLSGKVTADRGEVQALRVKATDTVHRISYTVFTTKGRYQIFNLPPGQYTVQVIEGDFDSPTANIEVKTGDNATADLALKAKDTQSTFELVDYDTLYPPGPGRAILEKHCWGCHGTGAGWHKRGTGYTEEEWRKRASRMWDQKAWESGVMAAGIKGAPALDHQLTDEEKDTVVKYLAATFPPDHPRRDWKLDPIVRDEAALGKALYVEYDAAVAPGPDFADGKISAISPFMFPSLERPGIIWLGGFGAGSIVAVDTKNPDYATRTREWRIPYKDNINPRPHVVIEFKGKVYYAGLGDDAAGEFDPETEKFQRFPAPRPNGGGHTIRADSKGNLWFTTVYGYSRINRVDAVTKEVTEYNPIQGGANWYGILPDKQDRIWAVGYGAFFGVEMYDPKTDKWTTYPTTATNRRLTIDPKGKVWANQYYGNAIAKVDPDTGKVTEYKLPLKYGNPYESWSDRDGNIWVEN
jgi:mono/diheme cytochrome c family protein